jgi:hypothetical protein
MSRTLDINANGFSVVSLQDMDIPGPDLGDPENNWLSPATLSATKTLRTLLRNSHRDFAAHLLTLAAPEQYYFRDWLMDMYKIVLNLDTNGNIVDLTVTDEASYTMFVLKYS